jgi:hypothetical protein
VLALPPPPIANATTTYNTNAQLNVFSSILAVNNLLHALGDDEDNNENIMIQQQNGAINTNEEFAGPIEPVDAPEPGAEPDWGGENNATQ